MQFEENYRNRLFSLKDEAYYDFTANLVPGSTHIGIRIPVLRKLAKEFLKEDYEKYLAVKSIYSEEKMIKGFIIAGLKKDFPTILRYLESYLLEIDNWSICDSVATSLKVFKKHLDEGRVFIDSCLKNDATFTIRFGLVLLLCYYLKDEYLDYIFKVIEEVKSEEYYVKMALAWLISALYVKYPEETVKLFDGRLDKFTHNKAISKICDSLQVPKEEKDYLRSFRRK